MIVTVTFQADVEDDSASPFVMSAPKEVKDCINRKVREMGGTLIWNWNSNGDCAIKGTGRVEIYLLLSWVDEFLSKSGAKVDLHVSSHGTSGQQYVFRTQRKLHVEC